MLEYHAAIRNQWDGYMDEHEWISKTQYWVEEPDACRYVISCAFKNMSPDVMHHLHIQTYVIKAWKHRDPIHTSGSLGSLNGCFKK